MARDAVLHLRAHERPIKAALKAAKDDKASASKKPKLLAIAKDATDSHTKTTVCAIDNRLQFLKKNHVDVLSARPKVDDGDSDSSFEQGMD
jgi:hypothetical protein